jgi:hypothetical protein
MRLLPIVAFRVLRRRPVPSFVVFGTLTLAVAATIVTASVVRTVLVDPLPCLRPDRLVS